MPPLLSSLAIRCNLADSFGQQPNWRLAQLIACHLLTLAILIWIETDLVAIAAFVLAFALVNFFWLGLLGRPGLAAVLSLALLIALVVLSRFKFQILWMTASFIDVMIIDADTFAFLAMVFPKMRPAAFAAAIAAVMVGVVLWRLDPLRMRRRTALVG